MPKKGPPFGKRHRLQRQYWQPVRGHTGIDTNLEVNIDVGARLRQMRENRNLTIRALAEQSGLAINTISLIENGKTSPSVATLQQLAFALRMPIAAFFENGTPKNNIAFYKANQRPRAAFEHGILEDLGAGMVSRGAEPFLVELEPQAGSGSDPIVHTGREFVYCLVGALTYTIEDQEYVLEVGDSLLFEAHLPHRWRNEGTIPSRSLLVLCPTDEEDHPTEIHFVPE